MNFRTATLLVLGMFGSFAVVITAVIVLFWSPSGRKTQQRTSEKSEKRQSGSVIHSPGVTPAPDTDSLTISETTSATEANTQRVDATVRRVERAVQTEATAGGPQRSSKPEIRSKKPPELRKRSIRGRKTQQNVQLEQEEMKLLREAMERRLNERILTRERKLDQLAKQCDALEAGEAVQILTALDDPELGKVLERMSKKKALQIAALLTRLGRGNAISLK